MLLNCLPLCVATPMAYNLGVATEWLLRQTLLLRYTLRQSLRHPLRHKFQFPQLHKKLKSNDLSTMFTLILGIAV